MSTRAGGSPGLINRSMCNFSLTFTVVDQKYQFEHCIGKTIQRVSQSMDCVRGVFFGGGGGESFTYTKYRQKYVYRDLNFMLK